MHDVLALSVGTRFQVHRGELPDGRLLLSPVMTRESGRMARYSHEGRSYSVALSGNEGFTLVSQPDEQDVPVQLLQAQFA